MSSHYLIRHAASPPAELEEAIRVYRDFWTGMRMHEYGYPANFDGSKDDLDALAYCVYETGFPEEDYRHASLIWAQAIVNLTELRWLEPIARQIAIGGPTVDHPRLVFFPHARLLEIAEGSHTQFDVFALLTDLLLLQAFHASYESTEIPKLCALAFGQDYSGGTGSSFHQLAPLTRLLSRSAARVEKSRAIAYEQARQKLLNKECDT